MPASRKPLQDVNPQAAETAELEAVKQIEAASQVTPTRVLRSGRRIAATPQVPTTTKKRAARILVEKEPEAQKKLPTRVPVSAQESREALLSPETSARTEKKKQQLQLQAELDQPLDASGKLEESPISGLIENAGSICLIAAPPEEPAPPGLLTEIRKAQREVHQEQQLSDLRAEILAFQEDIRREGETESASSEHTSNRTSTTSTNRYQDTPSSRKPRGGPFRNQQEGDFAASPAEEASPFLRAPQNTPAAGTLVPMQDLLKTGSGSSESDSDSGSEGDGELELESALNSSRASGDIQARIAALRLSQESSATALDTDGSDLAEKLEALRTRTALDDVSSPEPADLREIETIEEGGEIDSAPGSIPRRVPGPSFMERKLRQLQEAEWEPSPGLKKHESALERVKKEAALTKKDDLSSAEKSLTRKLVQNAVGNAVKSDGKSLGETLKKHKSRLEKEKETAEASKTFEKTAVKPRTARVEQGLGENLRKHKSKVQLEKEAVLRQADSVEEGLPGYMRPTAASRHAAATPSGLGEGLLVPRSRLEKEKAAAAAAAKAEGVIRAPRGGKLERRAETSQWGGLGDMKVHKSRLERERELAVQKPSGPVQPKRELRLAASSEAGGLGDLKVHKSRLEREKEAWAKAGAQQKR